MLQQHLTLYRIGITQLLYPAILIEVIMRGFLKGEGVVKLRSTTDVHLTGNTNERLKQAVACSM